MGKKIILLCLILFFNIFTINILHADSEDSETWDLVWEKKFKEKIINLTSSRDDKNPLIYLVFENGSIQSLYKESGKKEWFFTNKYKINSTPMFAEEKLFFGVWDGTFYALSAFGGSEKWKMKAKGTVYSTPLFFRDRIYFGTWDGALYALKQESGDLIWKFKILDAISTTPQIYENILFIGSMDGKVYALDTRDGTKLWDIKTDWPGTNFQPVINKKNGAIILASSDKNIYSLDPKTGKIKWKFTTLWSGIYSNLLLINDLIFIPSYDGNLYCINASSGSLKWQINLGKFLLTNPPSQDDTLFLATEHGELIAVNIDNGIIKWRSKISEVISKKPLLFNDKIFLVSDAGYIYGIDIFSGDIKFQYIMDYYPDYIFFYDEASDMFFYFSSEGKLLAFNKSGKPKIDNEFELKKDVLTTAKKEYLNPPVFSPDGKFFLYYAGKKIAGDNNLYRVEIFDTTLKNIKLTQSTFNDISPQWFPDSTACVFSSNRAGNYNIYKMSLTNLEIHYYDEVENCQRTGDMSFEDINKTTPEDIDKKYLTQLTKEGDDETNPIPSPDGKKIVYTSNASGNLDLWCMDANGENKIRLTYEPYDEEVGAWSPDSEKIAYVSSRLKDKDIFLINPNGSNLNQITKDQTDEINPKWLNDTTIIYEKSSKDKKFSNIWTVDINGNNPHPITFGNFKDCYPAPSPDNKKIVFLSDRFNNIDNLWLINSNGIGLFQITNFTDEVHPASWSQTSQKIIYYVRNTMTNEKTEKITDVNRISLQEYFMQGEELIHKGEYAQAENLYTTIISDYPNQKVMLFVEPNYFYLFSHIGALYKMSVIAERSQNNNQMMELLNLIKEDKSSDYDEQKMFSLQALIQTKFGDLQFKNKKYDSAIIIYNQIIEEFPKMKNEWDYLISPYAYIRIAEIYEEQKKFKEAQETYLKVLDEYPESKIMLANDYIGTMALAYINLAKINETEYKDYDKTLQYYLNILTKYPNDNFLTATGITRGSYAQKALVNIKKIYISKEKNINIANWIELCEKTLNNLPAGNIKINLRTIINEMEKIKKGEKDTNEGNNKISKLIFASRNNIGVIKDSNFEIYSCEEDGSDLKRLTFNDVNDYKPALSPDCSKIAYHTLYNSNYEIFTMDIDGTHLTNRTNHPAYDFEPAWSMDGTRISFTSERDGNMEIYVMNEDGSDPINITLSPAKDFESNWSPIDERIIFTSNRDNNLEIYQIDIAMGTVINLTQNKKDDHEPVYSSDGNKILFTSNRDGNDQIFVMDSDGSNQKNVSKSKYFDYNPTWSQDNKYIFFVSTRRGNPKIFKMRVDGANQVQISQEIESYDIQPNTCK